MLRINNTATPNNILRLPLGEFVTPHKIAVAYAHEMKRICQETQSVSLAANNVGLRMNFFFVMAAVKMVGGKAVPHTCVRPEWEPDPKSEEVQFMESSPSLPGREFGVARHTIIRAEWTNAAGHRVEARLGGLGARIFQHETDQLRGIMIDTKGMEV